jgi:hypothetical protein
MIGTQQVSSSSTLHPKHGRVANFWRHSFGIVGQTFVRYQSEQEYDCQESQTELIDGTRKKDANAALKDGPFHFLPLERFFSLL